MERKFASLHKIDTLYWHPGCAVHVLGSYDSFYSNVALHIDVVAWKILSYSLWFYHKTDRSPKGALIDLRHPYRFWFWQSKQREATAAHAAVNRPSNVDFDAFGPVSVYRRLAPGALGLLTNRFLKGFYDLSSQQLGSLYSPARVPKNLFFGRIERAIAFANGDSECPSNSAEG